MVIRTGEARVRSSEVVGHPIGGRHRVTLQVPSPIDARG
jgi:hypothetical protein